MTIRNVLKLIAAILLLLPCASLRAAGACDVAPLPQGSYRVSSPYGMRLYPLNPHVWRMHWGADLVCHRFTKVSAMGDAVVLFAGRWGCYGTVVILGHPGDVVTLYAHLSRIAPGLHRGVCVKAGEVIGLSGDSGCVTGPHLHVECWMGKERRRVNPLLVCDALRNPCKGATL